MSLIEKIDAEIARIKALPTYGECTDSEEIYDDGRNQGWFEEALRIKELIISEQKEPQEPWEWKITDVETELGIGRTVERVHITTIGDKIRESNESLAEAMNVFKYGVSGNNFTLKTIMDHLNQPIES